ncbi:MAG: carbohydrate-binding domain-containing protein, partial [Clostridia bacterium]|nr:carbohydrate-binding domain-containing protein [Clostridia bacterium]
MKKRILSVIVTLALTLSLLCAPAVKAEAKTLKSASITVSGYEAGHMVQETSVSIPEGEDFYIYQNMSPSIYTSSPGSTKPGGKLENYNRLEAYTSYWLVLHVFPNSDITHIDITALSNIDNWIINGLPEGVTLEKVHVSEHGGTHYDLCLRLSKLPAPKAEIWVGGVAMATGYYLPIGYNAVTAEKPASGGYAYYENGTLYLNNYDNLGNIYDFNSQYVGIYALNDLTIVLEGESTVTGSDYSIVAFNNNLTVQGSGSLKLPAAVTGISVGNDIIINGGTLDIDGYYGLISNNIIINGGTVIINAREAGMYADNHIEIIGGDINIEIIGGDINITTNTVGLMSVNNITIAGGNVTVLGGYTGIGSHMGPITINGGNITLTSDFGIATFDSITINGGT